MALKIIFFAPRMHTNTIGWSEALTEEGLVVLYHVCFIGKTESHKTVIPKRLPQSKLSRLVVKFFGCGDGDSKNIFPSFFYYLHILHKESADFVVIRNPRRIGSIFALLSAKLTGAKVLLYTQSRFDKWSRTKRTLAQFLIKLIDGAWFSPILMDEGEIKSPARFYFLPFLIQKTFDVQENKPNDDVIRIVSVGKYKSVRKNHSLLLQALKALNLDVDWSLEIVGECNDRDGKKNYQRLMAEAQSFGRYADVKLKYNVPYFDMPKIFSRADLFILPASNEPAAISVLEALASGIPVICSDSCGTRAYVEALMPELIFKTDDVNDLSGKIATVLSSELRLQDYKFKARQTHILFSHDGFKERFRTILKEVWGVGFEY